MPPDRHAKRRGYGMRKATRLVMVLAAAALVISAVSGAALAKGPGGGKGHHTTTGGTGTISLVLLDSTDGVAHFGQHVTFTVSTSATQYPWVDLQCFQNGGLVYREDNGIFPTSLGEVFTLGPTQLWTGGAADCTATLQDWDSYSKNGNITNITSIPVQVAA
jgi:hypothetical protein